MEYKEIPTGSKSKCRVCGKICIEVKSKVSKDAPNWIKDMKSGDGYAYTWKHRIEQGHPPYPVADTDKEETMKDYAKFKEEMGESFMAKVVSGNRITIPELVMKYQKLKEGSEVRINIERLS